ncbi:hypothetical protein ASPSYDRAFT_67289 [Aspergillus sydowii CBS 593.65]|uniref:Ig-like domain-containing protein n=1 Tax=Aspergillus sydowii CBS 593.65 TaxID=1036612 RepID=A0A1L9TQB4_9EURO|nr:uncharacterized protein ASPSYDRAFT_67289 [Aspergillus sydowii CBS 593.65]OJJ61493.1 hypothetical protein ASPSYDRAFT_67289 [Aspergillus sydowii CBS 593.65]
MMKFASLVLATLLPLAMTAATPNEPGIGLAERADLQTPKNCKLQGQGNQKTIYQIPCQGSEVGSWNKGATIKVVCKTNVGGAHWYKTKAQLWSRNLNPGDGPGLKCQGGISGLPECEI